MHTFKTINKTQLTRNKWLTITVALFILIFSLHSKAMAQERNQMVRLAKIKVDPLQLEK